MTVAGSRLLAQRLAAPLTDPAAIACRHDAVAHFVADPSARRDSRERLKAAPDLARALARLVVGRGGPRDLAAIRDGITAAARPCAGVAARLRHSRRTRSGGGVAVPARRGDCAELAAALDDELPYLKRDGGFVRPGYDPALDELRALRDESRRVIAALQARYADARRRPRVEGQAQQRARLFRRGRRAAWRQADGATAQCDLHPSPDPRRPGALHHRGAWRTRGQDRQRGRPRSRHRDRDVRTARPERSRPTRRPSRTPPRRSRCSTSAARWRNSPPTAITRGPMVDDGPRFRHRGRTPSGGRAGADRRRRAVRRQPVRSVAARAGGCRPHLAAHRPEHGRQVHLPAPERADRDPRPDGQLRAGAQRHGSAWSTGCSRASAPPTIWPAAARPSWSRWSRPPRSSIRPAERALVILDEIGRGTATFDGLSIAWATIEHLHEVNRCRALFATHFHELTALAAKLPRLHNATMRVKEWQGEVVFLHEVVPAPPTAPTASRSRSSPACRQP